MVFVSYISWIFHSYSYGFQGHPFCAPWLQDIAPLRTAQATGFGAAEQHGPGVFMEKMEDFHGFSWDFDVWRIENLGIQHD